MSTSGPRAAIVSKHSSRMDVRELRELRGLDATEHDDRGLPLGSLSSVATPSMSVDQRRAWRDEEEGTRGRFTN